MRFVKFFIISVSCLLTALSYATEVKTPKELVFITSDHCPFCQAWERDVGYIYDSTPYAQHATLRRIDFTEISFLLPKLNDAVVGTPTFLIFENGVEIGRIEGYQSSEMFFWALSEYIQP